MKKNITIIILVAGIIVLFYFLLSEPKQPDSHKYEHDQTQADLKSVRAQRNAGLQKIDSLEKDVAKRDTLEKELRTDLAIYRHDLDKSVAKAVQLAKEKKTVTESLTNWVSKLQPASFPTNEKFETGVVVDYSNKYDSLANEVMNFAYLYDQYKTYADSLTKAVDSTKADYIAALTEQKRLYNELFEKFEHLNKLYDNLYKDYTGARKSLKREKLKTRIAALLALIAGGAAVIK